MKTFAKHFTVGQIGLDLEEERAAFLSGIGDTTCNGPLTFIKNFQRAIQMK